MLLRKGTVLNDRYRIIKSFGVGGFGAVYLAEDLNKGTVCAVKENLDDSQEEVMGKFLREASMLYNLRHSNLPEVWDHFVIPGEGQYLVMEYIEGQTIKEILEQSGKPLPEQKVITWISQVCDALSYLHSQTPPIIHRDIKPSNIRITTDGKAVLVDFGIAKFYNEFSRTSTVARAITPGYSPLEQYGIGKTDERSDVYALGATVYKLLTGVTPRPSVDIAAGTAEPPAPACEVNPSVSRGVSMAIQRAMQLRVQNRTQSVAQFQTEIQRGLSFQFKNELHRKFIRRALPILVGLIYVILLVFIGSAIFYYLF